MDGDEPNETAEGLLKAMRVCRTCFAKPCFCAPNERPCLGCTETIDDCDDEPTDCKAREKRLDARFAEAEGLIFLGASAEAQAIYNDDPGLGDADLRIEDVLRDYVCG